MEGREEKERLLKEREEDKVCNKAIAPTTAVLILFYSIKLEQTKTPASWDLR
jgi:hypothetical protein